MYFEECTLNAHKNQLKKLSGAIGEWGKSATARKAHRTRHHLRPPPAEHSKHGDPIRWTSGKVTATKKPHTNQGKGTTNAKKQKHMSQLALSPVPSLYHYRVHTTAPA